MTRLNPDFYFREGFLSFKFITYYKNNNFTAKNHIKIKMKTPKDGRENKTAINQFEKNRIDLLSKERNSKRWKGKQNRNQREAFYVNTLTSKQASSRYHQHRDTHIWTGETFLEHDFTDDQDDNWRAPLYSAVDRNIHSA